MESGTERPFVDPAAQPAPFRVIEIAPSRGWSSLALHDLWSYRELLLVMLQRDLTVRYRQTLLGVAWVLGQPLLSMLIFTLLFNRIARFEAGGGLPYALFVLAGILPWTFVAAGVQGGSNSLLGSAHLISKIYFPRLLLPLSAVLLGLADLAVAAVLLVALMVHYAVAPNLSVLLLPIVLLLTVALTLGLALWLAALNVRYRDVRVVIPFLLQVWMYATPVVYPLEVLPEGLRALVLLNPASGIVLGFRACLLGTPMPWNSLLGTALSSALLLTSGAFVFRRMERTFADVL